MAESSERAQDTIKHQTESAEEIWRLLLSHCAKLAAAGMKPEKIAKIFGPSFKHPKAKSSKARRSRLLPGTSVGARFRVQRVYWFFAMAGGGPWVA